MWPQEIYRRYKTKPLHVADELPLSGCTAVFAASASITSTYSTKPTYAEFSRDTSRAITNHALIFRWNAMLRYHVESSIHPKEG